MIKRLLLTAIFTFNFSLFVNASTFDLFLGISFDDRILKFDGLTGDFESIFVSGSGRDRPYNMSFGPDGDLYVCSDPDGYDNDRVLSYNQNTGALISSFDRSVSTWLSNPRSLTFGTDGDLYVVTPGRVLRYDTVNVLLKEIFVEYDDPDKLFTDLAFGPDGNLYVADAGTSSKILRFNGSTGEYIDTFISSPEQHLRGLRFGPDGNLYVYATNEMILRFDASTGEFIDNFVSGVKAGDFTFGPDGNLYITLASGMGVMRFDGVTGEFIDHFVDDYAMYSWGIAFSPDPICKGDFNDDGYVDESDLSIFAFAYGTTDCNWWAPLCDCDFDNDDDVDGSDHAAFAEDFGRTDCP